MKGELEADQNCNILTPHSYGHNSVSFPFSWAAQPGAWGPSLSGTWFSFQHLLSNWSEALTAQSGVLRAPSAGCWFSLQHLLSNWLNFLSSGLYDNLTSTLLPASVTISHSIQPLDSQGYILIFLDRMHQLFTLVHFLFWQLGRVGGQYATISMLKRFGFIKPSSGLYIYCSEHEDQNDVKKKSKCEIHSKI